MIQHEVKIISIFIMELAKSESIHNSVGYSVL